MNELTNGYVIRSGNNMYLHRTGTWVEYESPGLAYVWPAAKLLEIAEHSTSWEDKPKIALPASYDSATGITKVFEGEEGFEDLVNTSRALFFSGQALDITLLGAGGSANVVVVMQSL